MATAARWLGEGACIGMPTETVYGLAANALDAAAVTRIFAAKNRPYFDPLIVHVPDLATVDQLVQAFPAALADLAQRYWPGPLTLLLPKREVVPDLVTAGLPRVGIRMPAHPVAQALLKATHFPLAAPSANPFGYISPTTSAHVYAQLQGKIPYILEGGPCTVGVESTIVGWEDGQAALYRYGGISVEAIEAVVGPLRLCLNESSNPAAPGMLTTHYAPRKPLYLGEIGALGAQFMTQKVGILAFGTLPELPSPYAVYSLSETGNLAEAAQRLFTGLRTLDGAEVDVILAQPVPNVGLGRAINDRLRRASA